MEKKGYSARLHYLLAPLLIFVSLIFAISYQGGSRSSLMSISLLILIATLGLLLLKQHKLPPLPIAWPIIFLALFCGWVLLSVFWTLSVVSTLLLLPFYFGVFIAALIGYWLSRENIQDLHLLLMIGIVFLVASFYYHVFYAETVSSVYFLNRNSFAAFLNLLIFPLCALYLSGATENSSYRPYGIVIAAGAMGIAMTASRGALLGTVISFTFLVILFWKNKAHLKGLIRIIAIFIAGFGLGALMNSAIISGKLAGLITGEASVSGLAGRLIIWDATLGMFSTNSSLTGIGPGAFWLLYPQYKDPLERTAENFAHNDYLQLLLENGIIGFGILILVAISFVYVLVKNVRTPEAALKISGYSAALIAVLSHSFFSFNLYSLSILIVLGLYIGIILSIVSGQSMETSTAGSIKVTRSTRYKKAIRLLLLMPPVYFVSTILVSSNIALSAMDEKDDFKAVNDLIRATHIYKYSDEPHLLLADRIKIAIYTRNYDEKRREKLIAFALKKLDEAAAINPLRWQNYFERAQLLQKSKHGSFNEVSFWYEKSLKTNPGFLPARVQYTRYLLSEERVVKAHEVLEDGWNREYYTLLINGIDYLKLLSQKRQESNDTIGVAKIRQLLSDLESRLKEKQEWVSGFKLG